MYIFVLIASTSSLQVCGERETSASPRQQNVDGVDKQSQGRGPVDGDMDGLCDGITVGDEGIVVGPVMVTRTDCVTESQLGTKASLWGQ